jgi:hypothetical protein
MKKLLVGCLLFVVVGLCAATAAGYFLVWVPLTAFLENIEKTTNYESRITVQTPYTPPTDSLLTQAQVDRFVAVQRAMGTAAGEDLVQLQQVANRAAASAEAEDLGAMMQDLRQLGALFTLARTVRDAQVEAINAQGLSLAEYQWISTTFFKALVPDGSLVELEALAREGSVTPEALASAFEGSGEMFASGHPSAALVAPYQAEAVNWLPLFLFGF